MKLRHKTGAWGAKNSPMSIAHVIEHELSDRGYDSGIAESARSEAENAIQFLGELTQKLYEKGVLDEKDILSLDNLHWYEVVKDE